MSLPLQARPMSLNIFPDGHIHVIPGLGGAASDSHLSREQSITLLEQGVQHAFAGYTLWLMPGTEATLDQFPPAVAAYLRARL